ncbi:MAG: hypothetical protein ACI8W7_002322 [Gammaproteobacteria bacterium]|jgi:hypothetical protein
MGLAVLKEEGGLTTFKVEGGVRYCELRDHLIAFYLNDDRRNILGDLSAADISVLDSEEMLVLARVVAEMADRVAKAKAAVYGRVVMPR